MNKGRLEAFSDGVFAIIITIMVLELKVPHGDKMEDLYPLLPTLFCYVQSFMFVGVYWVNHHHLVHTVNKVSSSIMWTNLFLLFNLSLVPFLTSWVGESGFAAVPVALYAVLLATSGLSYTILQFAITRCNKWNELLRIAMRGSARKGILSLILYSAAIPLAFVNPFISEAIFLLVSITWLIPDKRIEKAFEHEK